MDKDIFKNLIGFDWDDGNILKNWEKHEVTDIEAEEIFYDNKLLIMEDKEHSLDEVRYIALGITSHWRMLTVIFTIRSNKIRIISARDQNRKERIKYEKG